MKNNRFIALICLLLAVILDCNSQNTPAFPGAEGYGKYVTGGRGGRVIYVTKTTDDPSSSGSASDNGSLRQALKTSGNDPITIVFKCGGVIQLGGQLSCSRYNVTLAGQTALGDGICVMNYGINFSGQNIIVRYMRFRVGDRILQNDPALTFSNGRKAIIDHCSFSWSTEENVNITDVDSVTLQWCINSESLYQSSHPKGPRAYAAQWGGEHASYHHNLLANHHSRMPRQNGNTSNDHHLTWDYRNNVHYNWGSDGAFYGGGIEELGGFCHSNIINNYYKPGPATTTNKSSQYFCAPSGGRPAVVGTGNDYIYGYGLWYLTGNVMYNNPAKTSDNWSGLSGSTNHYATDTFDAAPITMTTADIAYNEVLASAGATKPVRDTFDRRVIYEAQNGTSTHGGILGTTCGIIDSHITFMPVGEIWETWEKSLYRLVRYTYPEVPLDTDLDGIPDWWEAVNGLNSNDGNDGKTLAADASGYTNLEHYLNSNDVGKTQATKVNNIDAMPMLSLYPNPVITSFTINSVLLPKLVEVYNSAGSKVASFNAKNQKYFSIIPFPNGQYIIKVIFTNGKTAAQKIIK